MQKESGASRWCLWVMVWFYDDGKDIIEICRVAAYLNHSLHPIATLRVSFSICLRMESNGRISDN